MSHQDHLDRTEGNIKDKTYRSRLFCGRKTLLCTQMGLFCRRMAQDPVLLKGPEPVWVIFMLPFNGDR